LRPISVGRGHRGLGRDIGPCLPTRHFNVIASRGNSIVRGTYGIQR
jgi:hypothetical protein